MLASVPCITVKSSINLMLHVECCIHARHSHTNAFLVECDDMKKKIYIYISDITPDPGGRRPQRPCAQGRTSAKQEQAQEAAPAQTKDQTVGKATTNGRTTKQEGKGWPTPTPTEAAPCTPQPTYQARTPRLVTRTATSCARGGDVPGQQQGRGGTARDKPWQPQQGYHQKEMPQATPPTHAQTQNMP